MARYSDAEILQSGQTIQTSVVVDIDSFIPISGQDASKNRWSGVLHPPNKTGLKPRETYQLVIPKVLSARIEISEEPNATDNSVAFTVIGDLATEARQ